MDQLILGDNHTTIAATQMKTMKRTKNHGTSLMAVMQVQKISLYTTAIDGAGDDALLPMLLIHNLKQLGNVRETELDQ